MSFLGGPVIMCAIGIALSVSSLAGKAPRAAEALPMFEFMAALGALMAYWWLRFPSTIEWHGDGTVSFKGPVRAVQIPLSAIESIRTYGAGAGFLALRYSRKKLLLLNQFDQFHEFLHLLKESNPRVELRGC
jgi:hypothetical protein